MKPNPRAGLPSRGDLRITLSNSPRVGWLLMDGVTDYDRSMYPRFVSQFGTGYNWFLPGSTSGTFKLMSLDDLYLVSASTASKAGTVSGETDVTLNIDNIPAHDHSEQGVTINDTPSQQALLNSVLGIALGNVTKPPTVSARNTRTGKTGSETPKPVKIKPRSIAVNIYIFAGVSGLKL